MKRHLNRLVTRFIVWFLRELNEFSPLMSLSIQKTTSSPPPDDASAYQSLRVELAHIFGPVVPRSGETWNEAMLRRITEHLIDVERKGNP